MDGQILIPTASADRGNRQGRQFLFWHTQWDEISAQAYTARKQEIKESVDTLLSVEVPTDRNIYAEVRLDDRASAKTTRPSDIWKSADMEIVEATDDQVITISGRKSDFETLAQLIEGSSYENAAADSGLKKKETNISREVFAMASFASKNESFENRIDKALQTFIDADRDEGRTVDCFIELYRDAQLTDYDNFYDLLSETIEAVRIKKEDPELFFNNMYFRATLSVTEIKALLSDQANNFIRVIRMVPELRAQRSYSSVDLSSVQIAPPETDQVFGLVDSGVQHSLLNGLVAQTEKFLPAGATEDKTHGTFVGSRALFGDGIHATVTSGDPTLVPIGKCLDVQVLHLDDLSGDTKVDPDVLRESIEKVTSKYQNVKVYNVAIASGECTDERFPSPLSETLDKISREKDILFICPTGNQHIHVGEHISEEDIFERYADEVKVSPPGDGVSVLTVGSIAPISDSDAISSKNFPSPFSRSCFVRGKVKKPELVANGGNYLKEATPPRDVLEEKELSKTKYGVNGLTPRGLARDNGTSEAAPIVTHEAVKTFDFIRSSNLSARFDMAGNESNLVRALLVHSTAFNSKPAISNTFIRRAYGFGVPQFQNLSHDGPDRVTMLYADKLDLNDKKHKLHIELPEFVKTSKTQFIFTLAFAPPVDKNYKQYNMMGISSTLRTVVPALNAKGKPILAAQDSFNSSSEWTRDGVNYANKDSGIAHFCITKNGLGSTALEALLQLWIYPEYEKRINVNRNSVFLPYAFALTIIDKQAQGLLRSQLMASNQFTLMNRLQTEIQV